MSFDIFNTSKNDVKFFNELKGFLTLAACGLAISHPDSIGKPECATSVIELSGVVEKCELDIDIIFSTVIFYLSTPLILHFFKKENWSQNSVLNGSGFTILYSTLVLTCLNYAGIITNSDEIGFKVLHTIQTYYMQTILIIPALVLLAFLIKHNSLNKNIENKNTKKDNCGIISIITNLNLLFRKIKILLIHVTKNECTKLFLIYYFLSITFTILSKH